MTHEFDAIYYSSTVRCCVTTVIAPIFYALEDSGATSESESGGIRGGSKIEGQQRNRNRGGSRLNFWQPRSSICTRLPRKLIPSPVGISV